MMNASELILVGIDVSKDTLELALDDKGKTQCFSNDVQGVEQILSGIRGARSDDAPALLQGSSRPSSTVQAD